jgi:hypothetical protein
MAPSAGYALTFAVVVREFAAPVRSDNESMIRKSGNRFSEEIMLQQRDEIAIRFNLIGS